MHRASPFDDAALRAVESGNPWRFGGSSAIEDTYHVMLAGPLQRVRSSAACDAYGEHLRQELFEALLEFEHHMHYDNFCARQLQHFRTIVDYDKALRAHAPALTAHARAAYLDAFRLGDLAAARAPVAAALQGVCR